MMQLEEHEVEMLKNLVRREIEDLELCIVNGGGDSGGSLRLSACGLQVILEKLEN